MNNRGLSLEERAHEMHLMLWKDLMNKTSVTTQAQYFTFIGQIPRNSHEYHLCNTSRSMGRRGSSRRPWWISSTVRLEAKVGRKGTRVAFCPPKDASVRWRGGQAGSAMAREHPCCLPIEQGTRRPGSQGSNPACTSLLNFSPISITLRRSMRSSSSTTKHAWGNDLLISVWFPHPMLIEIHTASLVWLSSA